MTKKEFQELVEVYESHYKYYKGWVFEREYQDLLVYHQMGGPINVHFTPDYDGPGEVSIQVSTKEGEEIETKSVDYHPSVGAINPHELFTIVRPFLEKYDTW